MSTYRLDTARLARDIDTARRAGFRDEIPYRQVARAVGVSPGVFSRLNSGQKMDADALISLLVWLSERDPDVTVLRYAAPMPSTPRPHEVIINPGGGPYAIEDLDGFLAAFPPDQEPMVDLGGGTIVPLREMADIVNGEPDD